MWLDGNFTLADLGDFNRTGGTVELWGTLDNTGTTFTLNEATGSWNMHGGAIIGGVINETEGAKLQFDILDDLNELHGVTINGDLDFRDCEGSLGIYDSLTVNGDIYLSDAFLSFWGPDMVLDNTTVHADQGIIAPWPYGSDLELGPNLVIHGQDATIGENGLPTVNNGLISADTPAGSDKPLALVGSSFTNNGIVEAINGGAVYVGEFGTYTNSETGVMRATNGTIGYAAANAKVWHNYGLVSVEDATLHLGGSWKNHATITAVNSTLTMGFKHSDPQSWLNEGLLLADNCSIDIDKAPYDHAGINTGLMQFHDCIGQINTDWLNDGVFELTGLSGLWLTAQRLENYADGTLTGGTWIVRDISLLAFDDPDAWITTNAADIILDGPGAQFPALSYLETNEGHLTLTGGHDFATIAALFNGGQITIGEDSTLSVAGDYVQSEDGMLDIVLADLVAGDDFGLLEVVGSATLSGTLSVQLLSSYSPQFGDSFEFLTAASVWGTFSGYTFPDLPTPLCFAVDYAASSVTLRVVPEPATAMLLAASMMLLPRRRQR